SFFRDSDRTLLVGDAFCTTKQDSLSPMAMQRPELHGPPAYYTSDWDSAKDSVAILAKLKPQCVAPGHGSPMRGLDVAPALDDLARDFDTVARPRNERHAAEVQYPVRPGGRNEAMSSMRLTRQLQAAPLTLVRTFFQNGRSPRPFPEDVLPTPASARLFGTANANSLSRYPAGSCGPHCRYPAHP